MSDLSKFRENYSNTCTPVFFGSLRPEMIGGSPEEPVNAETGASLAPNGDLNFRFYYPEAATVVVVVRSGRHRCKIDLEKDAEGFFSGSLPFTGDPNWVGMREVSIQVDGVNVVSPRLPLLPNVAGFENYVFIPDTGWDDYLLKKVPHGTLSYEIYWSEVLNDWQRCMVYTPAEYQQNPDKKYPVLYLHHPGFGNETSWMFAGKVPCIMDNLLAQGEAVPFIIVTNQCSAKLPSDGRFGMDGYLRILLEDCIPFIEEKYRVLSDKWNRAAAGSSWGGMLSSRLVFEHPELFGSIGMLSSGLRCVDTHPVLADNHYLDWMRGNAEEVGRQYKLIFRSHGEIEYTGRPGVPGENGNPTILEDEVFLSENGIDKLPCYARVVFPGYKHMWETFSRGFSLFARQLFRSDS